VLVVRHAKAASPPDVEDHDRVLTGRGERDAAALGRWLQASVPAPDLVVCSTALRARGTWEIAGGALPDAPAPRLDPRLYLAAAETLRDVAREAAQGVRTLVLVGHNPGVHTLASRLAGDGEGRALAELRTGFPTCAVAVLAVSGEWGELSWGGARLDAVAVPRG
jgi:phosphohistidine phosphatase